MTQIIDVNANDVQRFAPMANQSRVQVAGVDITTDDQGRYNLNALHKASGLGSEKAPAQWLRGKQAQELALEVESQTMQICIVSSGGRNGGTFAHELLAISYAGWISPSFQLTVNQVFLNRNKSGQSFSLPNFNNPIEAARAWADECEGRMIAEQTKAQIGARREATAMNTASQAAKKAKKLELELDRSTQYSSVKRMEKIHKGEAFPWRRLKTISEKLGIEPRKIHDANYGQVNTYHADVWREAYGVEIDGSTHSREFVQ